MDFRSRRSGPAARMEEWIPKEPPRQPHLSAGLSWNQCPRLAMQKRTSVSWLVSGGCHHMQPGEEPRRTRWGTRGGENHGAAAGRSRYWYW